MLRINGLKAPTRIGIYDWEHQIDQTLSFDLEIPIDVKRAKDNLANVVDYAAVSQCITQFVRQQSFYLLETAAEQVVTLLQNTFSLPHLRLTVTKLHAVRNAGSIQITVNR